MMRWIILATLIVMLSVAGTVAVQYLPGDSDTDDSKFPVAAKVSGPQPEVVVETPLTYKFGTKAQFEKFSHDWVIKNQGKGDLELHLQGTTCSCTVAEFPHGAKSDSMVVKPGAETTIHLSFETRDNNGHFVKSATVGTNDLKLPALMFVAEGEVHPSIVTVPPEKVVMFSSISNDVESTARIALYSPDRPDLKIFTVVSSKPDLVVGQIEPLNQVDRLYLKTKAGWRINIRVKPGMPLGPFHEVLTVKTDHPKQSEIKFDVAGKIDGPITVMPANLSLPSIPGRQGGKGEVTLTVRGRRATTFAVEKKPKKLEVAISAADSADKKGQYKVTVTIPPGTSSGQIEDHIILSTDHPQAGSIKIPVRVFVKGPS